MHKLFTKSAIAVLGMGASLLLPATIGGCDETTDDGNVPSSCPEGFAECDSDPGTICETQLETSAAHCGECGLACGAGEGELAMCDAGACVAACLEQRADCNGDASDGCEIDTAADSDNCGSCGRSCGATGCIDGGCEVTTLASGFPSPIGIAIDDDHVYWGNFVPIGDVLRVPKSGGAVEVLAAGLVNPFEVAEGNGELFVTEYGEPPATNARVLRIPSSGGTPTVLVTAALAACEIALDDTYVYWASSYGQIAAASIHRVPRAGGTDEILLGAEDRVRDLQVYDGRLYWLTGGQTATIVRSNLDGSGREVVLANIPRPSLEIAVGNEQVYFGSVEEGTVSAVGVAGGEAQVLFAAPGDLKTIELTGSFLYMSTGNTGTIERGDVQGGSRVVLASGGTRPFDLVVDDESVFWSDRGASSDDGAIYKTAR